MRKLFSFTPSAPQQAENTSSSASAYRGGYGYFCHRTGLCPCLPCSLHHAKTMQRANREAWDMDAYITEKGKHHDSYKQSFIPSLV